MADDGSVQRFVIRDAAAADTMDLARLAVMAGHGLLDVFYRGLIPGKSTLEIVADRRMLRQGNFAELANWRVAMDRDGGVLGALNSFPHDVFDKSEPDPCSPQTGWRLRTLLRNWRLRPRAHITSTSSPCSPSAAAAASAGR